MYPLTFECEPNQFALVLYKIMYNYTTGFHVIWIRSWYQASFGIRTNKLSRRIHSMFFNFNVFSNIKQVIHEKILIYT